MLTVLKALRLRGSSAITQMPQNSRFASSDFTVISDDDLNQEESKEVVPKSIVDHKPICHSRDEFWKKYPPINPACSREGWIENLSNTGDDNTNELIKLHPDVWAIRPRLDIIYQNLEWQKWYKKIDWEYEKDRYEMEYHQTRRPWPQKGGGMARHRTTTSPLWIQGGKAHGNKGPRSYHFMLNYQARVWGLIHTLSAKFAQDDVKFVENLEIPSDDPEYIDELIDKRGWALSTLFVDKTDKFPSNLTGATMNILHVNMIPAYGLNVHDMLKHKNLVMTKAAVEHIEEKLLFAQRRLDVKQKGASSRVGSDVEMPTHNSFGSLS